MATWVKDDDHSWHLPCPFVTINLKITGDLDSPVYRALIDVKTRGPPQTHQILSGDKEDVIKATEGWMQQYDDTDAIKEYVLD